MEKTCIQCGNSFKANSRKRKYCSDSCKSKAYVERKKEPSIGTVKNRSKPNEKVVEFLKQYLEGLFDESYELDHNLTDVMIGVERVRLTPNYSFVLESLNKSDIEKINQQLADGTLRITKGKSKIVDVQKELDWCMDNGITPKQKFDTYKVILTYDKVRTQFKEYEDEDLITT